MINDKEVGSLNKDHPSGFFPTASIVWCRVVLNMMTIIRLEKERMVWTVQTSAVIHIRTTYLTRFLTTHNTTLHAFLFFLVFSISCIFKYIRVCVYTLEGSHPASTNDIPSGWICFSGFLLLEIFEFKEEWTC